LQEFIGLAKDVARTINEQAGLKIDHVIPVTRIPKTTSGKIQRHMLGEAYVDGIYEKVLQEIADLNAAAHVAEDRNMTETESVISGICNDVLKDKILHLEDVFFEVGISSLNLADISQRIDDAYPGLVDVTDLFEYQTIAEIAAYVDKKLSNAA